MYNLIWTSKYGKEKLDSFATKDEAIEMGWEYIAAVGSGHIDIIKDKDSELVFALKSLNLGEK